MFLVAIASASRRILIANAYFVPDPMTVDMLVAARGRGVEVEIVVPGPILDAQVVRRASRAKWGPLLEAGVRTNFDDRSFRLNQEANLNVLDSTFGADQARMFAEDRATPGGSRWRSGATGPCGSGSRNGSRG